MLKKILVTAVMLVATGQSVLAADDYHKYGEWNLSKTSLYDMGAFVDNDGNISGGQNGDEYILFVSNDTNDSQMHGFVYRVTVNGDPNAHPEAPNGLPVADRNFTFVSDSGYDPDFRGGGLAEFYVDATGIYYGGANKVVRWNHDWSNKTTVLTSTQSIYEGATLGKHIASNTWWTADSRRKVYRYNDATHVWDFQFTYPDLGGNHHDGLEIVNNKLYLSDMTSDFIIVYDLNSSGDVVADSNKTYTYTATNVDVEGMSYGPNQHFWFTSGYSSGGLIYEVGDGKLVPSCKQTFTYNTSWAMDRSKCDDIKVPGLANAVMARFVVSDDKTVDLEFATANTVAKDWLENKGFTVKADFTLHTGDGFWTLAAAANSQTVSNGKLRNYFMKFEKDVVSFVGFGVSTDLNSMFAGKPVKEIRYYDSKWNIWKPADGKKVVPATQGLYIYPSGDFGISLK